MKTQGRRDRTKTDDTVEISEVDRVSTADLREGDDEGDVKVGAEKVEGDVNDENTEDDKNTDAVDSSTAAIRARSRSNSSASSRTKSNRKRTARKYNQLHEARQCMRGFHALSNAYLKAGARAQAHARYNAGGTAVAEGQYKDSVNTNMGRQHNLGRARSLISFNFDAQELAALDPDDESYAEEYFQRALMA